VAGESFNSTKFKPVSPQGRYVRYLPIAASQTWVRGDFVFNNAGAITLATAASATLLGVAMDDQTTPATSTLVPIYVEPKALYEGRVDADASGVAAGAEIDLVGASGAQMIDVGASSTNVFVFESLAPDETSSAQYAKAYVRINNSTQDIV